jgi:hypothetical protein
VTGGVTRKSSVQPDNSSKQNKPKHHNGGEKIAPFSVININIDNGSNKLMNPGSFVASF